MASNSPWHHLYNTKRWKFLRKEQLQREPLCKIHKAQGKIIPATIADHVVPHKGDETLFFRGDLQSLCKECHDSYKQRLEKSGTIIGCDSDGFPIDPNHHWSR